MKTTAPGGRVVYTDPNWALASGRFDGSLADIERAIFNERIQLDFGHIAGGRFIKEGPQFLDTLRAADAVVIYRARMTPEAVAVLKPHCRVVARQGVGIDNLNAELLRRAGILAFNVPDYCAGEVSDHTMAMVLALERNLCVQDSRLRAGSWSVYAGGYPRRLSGLTFGIIGFGRIGRATARKAQAFYGSVIAYDPFVHADLLAGYGVGTRQHLNELLEESDVVVLHAWLDEQSRHVINRESVRHVRPGAILVNTARGDLVEPEAVLAALEGGRLAGYGSDVFSPEDPNEHPVNRRILAFENVVATSHRAFLSRESERSLRSRVAEEIMYVLTTGQPPRFGRVA